jgi:hypothetical protein
MRTIGATVVACLGLAACVPGTRGDEITMNERIYRRGPEGLVRMGLACYLLEGGSGESAVGGGSEDFSYKAVSARGVLTVEVRSRQSLLAERRYDHTFAISGIPDEFTVLTNAGDEYRFRYWGSRDCDIARE